MGILDVVAVQEEGAECPLIFPGFPQLKLWPEAVVSLGDDVERLPHLHPRLEKRARAVAAERFSQDPLPLRQIYALAESHIPEVEPLRGQEALMELVRHSYAVRLVHSVGASSHFLRCASLAKNVSMSRLKRPRSLRELPHLARIVEDDLASRSRLVEFRHRLCAPKRSCSSAVPGAPRIPKEQSGPERSFGRMSPESEPYCRPPWTFCRLSLVPSLFN